MKQYAKQKIGDKCPACTFDLVQVTKESLLTIMNNKVKIYSIKEKALKQNSDFFLICPRCDAYALGIESEQGVPFKDRSGAVKTVHDIQI